MAKIPTLATRLACLSTQIAQPLLSEPAMGRTDPSRAGTTARGYGWAWQKLRLVILRRDAYRCQACKRAGRLRAANSVDHIINKAAGGDDDPHNLESLCKDCHDDKSAAEAAIGSMR